MSLVPYKCILVTGADGFIGSHLVERLVKRGYRVKALALYNAMNSWGWLEDLDREVLDSVEVISGDIRDQGSVAKMMKGVDLVFHLAALIGIPYSYESPKSYVATNISGTLNLLEEARTKKCIRIICTSTSEVYGSAQYTPIDESHPLQGQSPYAATKIGADRLAESYFKSFNLPITIVRPFNTYGPRQSSRAIIPTIITQLLTGVQQLELGSLHTSRDLVFVKDTVEGFCRIAECETTIGEEINICTGVDIEMGHLAEKIISLVNPKAEIVCDNQRIRPPQSEVERLLGSNEKLVELTGWKPPTEILDGLNQTISWFQEGNRLTHYKPGIYNI